jgi:hypothetical protein
VATLFGPLLGRGWTSLEADFGKIVKSEELIASPGFTGVFLELRGLVRWVVRLAAVSCVSVSCVVVRCIAIG